MGTDRIDYKDLDNRFRAHAVDAEGVECMEAVRDAARDLAVRICQVAPAGRERSLALTRVEEAMFWANAGIAREERSDG